MSSKFRFAIDRGGTFTDIYAKCPNGKVRTLKLLSVDPSNYDDAPKEGIRRILQDELSVSIPKTDKISCSAIEWIRMGTTVATNALLERKGERIALVITKGFKDLLYIGNQARPKIFDLKVSTPEVLYEEVIEIDCRVVPEMKGRCALEKSSSWPVVKGISGDNLLVKKTLDHQIVKKQLEKLLAKGIKSIAVVLIHSYTYHEDEITIGKIAESLGFTNISLSHQVMPMVRMVNRGFTACADAYLTPHIKTYVKGFACGFEKDLDGINVLFMQSDGGLTPMNNFNGSRAVLSGPAGGVVGYAVTTKVNKPVIGFDVGGTSTDVSRFSGEYEHVFESITAGITIQAPQLDINTVAAGGGSRLFFRSGLFVVGPESAGAHPGPVCYRKGGYLTVTDANVVLGRIQPDYFPKIFGSNENQPLDLEASKAAFQQLSIDVNTYLKANSRKPMLVEEIACGFIKVANEAMCRPIRNLTQAKGCDTRDHVLACFGGAGGQHSCAIASELGMSEVFIHKYAGILSAFGMACADVVHEEQEPSSLKYHKDNFPLIEKRFEELKRKCTEKLNAQGFTNENIETELFLHMRYKGTDGSMMCSPLKTSDDTGTKFGNFEQPFLNRYMSEYGFTIEGRDILIDDIRVRGIGKTKLEDELDLPEATNPPLVDRVAKVYFENLGFVETNIYLAKNLTNGHEMRGPAIIIDDLSTIIVDPLCLAKISPKGDIRIDVKTEPKPISSALDMVLLSIFSHRFMSIAEQMGRVLQRTAISTNIKERLDFSCALFGPDGGLVSNAPHIPVHLGAMQEAVQYQMNVLGKDLKEGDVILTNHPKAGGSHLPDFTVITPVFYKNIPDPVFFVASRGHHSDIGGITPGSMPPHSKTLMEEGASFKSFFLVRSGKFMEEELIVELMKPGKIPGSSGTRNLSDNIADLKAQVAANQKGIKLTQELVDHYSLEVVQAYMSYIQQNAETAVRDLLKDVGMRYNEGNSKQTFLSAVDYMDDGSPIHFSAKIDIDSGTAVCDFSGSGHEVWGNCNAPKAVTLSALIYCLRCMVGYDVPLNQGCLAPVKTIIPSGSILDPSENAAVVGGNVQTSQRVVDVILKAFQAVAASQGCMNNITFGQRDWGYYETVAGGAGAGPTWDGRSGVHTHMTNTRITDPEILETRYPVILDTFSLREGSGGRGIYRGGDGVIRRILFRDRIEMSILSERRVFQPYGLKGGQPGARGKNLIYKKDGRIMYLGPKTSVPVEAGDTFELLTPGGGGWGDPDNVQTPCSISLEDNTCRVLERGSLYNYSQAQISA